jgi:hypothetical protein
MSARCPVRAPEDSGGKRQAAEVGAGVTLEKEFNICEGVGGTSFDMQISTPMGGR